MTTTFNNKKKKIDMDLIINFIISRQQQWELVMYILYKRELFSKYRTEVLQYRNYKTSTTKYVQHN